MSAHHFHATVAEIRHHIEEIQRLTHVLGSMLQTVTRQDLEETEARILAAVASMGGLSESDKAELAKVLSGSAVLAEAASLVDAPPGTADVAGSPGNPAN